MSALFDRLKIAVCDDDEQDRTHLIRLLSEYLDLHGYSLKIDAYTSGEAFLSADISSYDLVILDIFMGELNGIETARKFAANHPGTQIIFCSTSNAYAAESYDVAALRYLTKPVEKGKFFGTLDRFFHAYTALRTLTYKQNRMDESIYVSEILWVEAGDHKCIIHTAQDQIVTRTSFAQISQQLADADFVKPIRYALVSLKAVATIPTDVFTLVDGTTIPISRDQRAEMKKVFTDYKMRSLLTKGGMW